MDSYTEQNKIAWEYDAYQFWVKHSGTPAERAKQALEDPKAMLRKYSKYLEDVNGLKIANICGSCGKKAIPLALLGASVTIFDLSRDNMRYALETAEAAGTNIKFIVGDVMEIDLSIYSQYFDRVFMEGGILHYFFDLDRFMSIMYGLLKDGGQMICSDFHPFNKVLDVLEVGNPIQSYFSTDIFDGEMAHAGFYDDKIRKDFPKCKIRRYTLSEIMNAVIDAGFIIRKFDEHPAWTDTNFPGEFTILAKKE